MSGGGLEMCEEEVPRCVCGGQDTLSIHLPPISVSQPVPGLELVPLKVQHQKSVAAQRHPIPCLLLSLKCPQGVSDVPLLPGQGPGDDKPVETLDESLETRLWAGHLAESQSGVSQRI